jgi:hypothetical protein
LKSLENGFESCCIHIIPTHRNHVTLSHQGAEPRRLKQLPHRQKVDRPGESSSNQRRIKVTQVIAGQYPRPSGNLRRSPEFDPANWEKDSPQKIHHRPVRQIDHIFLLSHLEREPEQYSTFNPLKTKPPRTSIAYAR